MRLKLVMASIFLAAVLACLGILAVLMAGDLELVRSITGNTEPPSGFWAFLGVGMVLVLAPSLFAWGYHVSFQSNRISRIGHFVEEISMQDAEHDGPIVPLPLSNDEVGRLSATFNELRASFAREMDEYERSREALRRLDEEKSQFLAIVSHELRTPLNTILGFSQLLLDGIEGEMPESQREDVRIIQMSGRNLLGLINDIIDLSAIESGTIMIAPGQVDMGELMREIHSEFLGQLRNKRTKLTMEILDEPLLARADRKRVYQVINNLLSNAVKFTPRGTVSIEARRDGDMVRFSVTDTGPGIPASDLTTIFSEFQQSGTSTMRSRGTGLGLAISKKLVELQEGTIEVTSVEGEGSTFTFTLPVHVDESDEGAGS